MFQVYTSSRRVERLSVSFPRRSRKSCSNPRRFGGARRREILAKCRRHVNVSIDTDRGWDRLARSRSKNCSTARRAWNPAVLCKFRDNSGHFSSPRRAAPRSPPFRPSPPDFILLVSHVSHNRTRNNVLILCDVGLVPWKKTRRRNFRTTRFS